jgi:hypothetical protein
VTLSSLPWQPGYPVDRRGEQIARRAASGPYGDTEYQAARIVARATGAHVVLQDDNAEARMPDLHIGYTDGRTGVGEVVTVTDQQRAAESRAFANGGLDLFGDNLSWQWWVTAPPNVDRRWVRAPLLQVLEEMEAANDRPPMLAPIDPAAASLGERKLLALGVTAVAANDRPAERRGHVRWQPEGVGGELDLDMDCFQDWLHRFLAEPLARAKTDKLTAVHGDIDRHLLVGVSWSAPWAVLRLLDQDVVALPAETPRLPIGLSHLWIWGCESPASRALAWWPDRGWFDVARRWATE